MRHLADNSANSGSLGKLERPLLMLLPTRKSHALHTGQEIFHMRHNRQKPKEGEESDYNVFLFQIGIVGAAKEQYILPENNAKAENH